MKSKKSQRLLWLFALIIVITLTVSLFSGVFATSELAEGNETELCANHTEHDESCGYTAPVEGSPCTHEHGSECYSHVLLCAVPEHTHAAECYDGAGSLICALEEHSHGYSCYELCCGMAEHMHSDECYDAEGGLICTFLEHIHSEPCLVQSLNCTHTHDDTCGYAEAAEGTPCTHSCELCAGGISDTNAVGDTDTDAGGADTAGDATVLALGGVAAEDDGDIMPLGDPAGPAFSIKWTAADKGELSADNMTASWRSDTYTDEFPYYGYGTLNMEFTNGDSVFDIGEVEIRLPLCIYKPDYGASSYYGQLTMPKAPETSLDSSFNYDYDTATDEIVIKNYEKLDSTVFFSCKIEYRIDMHNCPDPYTRSFSATGNLAGALLTSNELTASVDTDVKLYSVFKSEDRSESFGGTISDWDSAWGVAPADAADYFYVMFNLFATAIGNQDATVVFEDTPSSGGKIVAWEKNDLGPRDTAQSEYIQGDTAAFNSYASSNPSTYIGPFSMQDPKWRNRIVIVAYPRTLLDENNSATVQNSLTAYLTGKYDSDTNPVKDQKSYEYSKKVSISSGSYTGDLFHASNVGGATIGELNRLNDGQAARVEYSLETTGRGYSKVLDGGKYHVEIDAGSIGFKSTEDAEARDIELAQDDYYFRSVTCFINQTGTKDGVQTFVATDYENWEPANLYVKQNGSDTWELYAQVRRIDALNYSAYFPGTGETAVTNYSDHISYGYEVELPPNTYDFKLDMLSDYYECTISVDCDLYLRPTDNVLAYAAGRSELFVENSADFRMYEDQAGVEMAAQSLKETSLLNAFDETTTIIKKIDGTHSLDHTNSVESMPVRIIITKNFTIDMGSELVGMSADEILRQTGIVELRNGVFYDLLPAHCFVDPTTISAKNITIGDIWAGYTLVDADFTYEFVDNWRGSGRTMMIVRVHVRDGNINCGQYISLDDISPQVGSGFFLNYKISTSFADMLDYGPAKQNTVAFESLSGELEDAYPDDMTGALTGLESIEAYMYDLNNDGNGANTPNCFVYATNAFSFKELDYNQSGFTKRVNSSKQIGANSITVNEGERYSYTLRYKNNDTATSKGIVFYDEIEAAQNTFWKGCLRSVDVSQMTEKGIDAKVYYSTSTDLDLENTEADRLLSDNSKWSMKAPADLNAVTAIAVDASNGIDGQPYILPVSEAVRAEVNMLAPGFVEDLSQQSHNIGVCSATLINTGTESPFNAASQATTLSLADRRLTLTKTSDPVTGTQDQPAMVEKGDKINYTISLTNENEGGRYTQLELTDIIPDGLTIAPDTDILVWFDSDEANAMSVNSAHEHRLSMVKTGQSLAFTLDELYAAETINIRIPVTVAIDNGTFANTAVLTVFNNITANLRSETTYHQAEQKAASIRLSKNITNYTGGLADKGFFISVSGTGCDANGSVALKHGETSGDMTVIIDGDSATLLISEIVPMEFSPGYTVTIANAEGSTATVDGRTVTIHPGDNVTVTVNNTFAHTGFFKADNWLRNTLAAAASEQG